MKDYQNHTDRSLLNEYSYFRPMGPHPDEPKKNIEEMDAADVRELMKITDELARRVNPSVNTDTQVV